MLRLLTQHQTQTKLTHPAVWTSTPPPCLLHFPFAPPSVPDKLHILTVPSTQFHTKLNGFQQLAYWLVTMSEILSNTVLLEMGFKNEKLEYKIQKF